MQKRIDPSRFYVKTSRDSILTLNYSLKVVDRIPEKECYTCYATKGSYKFLYKDGKTIIINRDHRKVATLDVDHQSVLIGSVLYNVGRTDYSIIDLSGVIGE